jgi:inosine/xanthosine triphosphatase
MPASVRCIAIGSMNPIKIAAVKSAVSHIWAGAEFIAVEADSGVDSQPQSDEETLRGALNRARAALDHAAADVGIGLEGGVMDTGDGMFLTGWAAVTDKEGGKGLGSGGALLLPELVAAQIRQGRELGPVMDKMMDQHNLKQNQGTVGVLTKGLVNRKEAFERAVLFALSRFISPEYY